MSEAFNIRPATPADADAACALVCESIVYLCRDDHFGDKLTLEGWLANKTPKNMAYWMSAPGMNAFVAERAGEMIGVGAVRDDGEITLAYVSPKARFQGVTKAIEETLATGLIHTSNLYRTAPGEALAKFLVAHSFASSVFFCNSGAEANEGAFKFARRWAGTTEQPAKHEIIALRGAFHGRMPELKRGCPAQGRA